MADWKDLSNKAKNLTYVGIGKAKELGQTAKLNLDNVSEEENKKRVYAEIGKRYVLENPVAEEGYADLYRPASQKVVETSQLALRELIRKALTRSVSGTDEEATEPEQQDQ